MRLVFVGECMVEIAPDGAAYRKGFAGDTFNMAWYTRRMAPVDWTVDYVTAIGTDAISDEFAAFAAASGIGTDHQFRRPERSLGLYLISLQNGERSFSYWRSSSAARLLADDAAVLQRSLAKADLVCFSGITLAILDAAGRDNLAAALTRLRHEGGRIAFDPNIRPRLWTDAAEMRATLTRFAGLSDIILASFDDEAAHFGDASPRDTIARYQNAGARDLIVKNGGEPILAMLGSDLLQVPVASAPIIDSTAAGDSFNAGYLVAHLAGQPPERAIAAASALAREVIQHPGALSEAAVRALR